MRILLNNPEKKSIYLHKELVVYNPSHYSINRSHLRKPIWSLIHMNVHVMVLKQSIGTFTI